jgi:mannosylglycerate hydrolase
VFTLHIVSHTHWDREWYRTFQQFRFRLVRLMDELLDILERDPDYRFFLLDGQTVVLEDVLDVRPDLEEPLRRQVRAGRLLIGPWFVLPDEFLVSPEALVRNLLQGRRTCQDWGARMEVGYTPDSFGHIAQLPQLLRGFGIETAVFWRGVGEAPLEFRWAAPDGTTVLVCHLRDSYSNAAMLPADEEGFVAGLAQARDSLAPHAATSHLLLMQGTDHMRPRADLPRLLASASTRLPDRLLHSNLPAFVSAVRAELGEAGLQALPLRSGEMRDPRRAHLLPGVLSTRMWIKQRNHTGQTLLERWAEPFAALAEVEVQTAGLCLPAHIRRAWKYLLENHPHDSICGCSIDAVHRQMETRFDESEQLTEEVIRAALEGLAAQVDTQGESGPALLVFNPSSSPRTDRVSGVEMPPFDPQGRALVGPDGQPVPFQITDRLVRSESVMEVEREMLRFMVSQVEAQGGGGLLGEEMTIGGLQVWMEETVAHLAVSLSRGGGPTLSPSADLLERLHALLDDPAVTGFRVHLREEEGVKVTFLARDVPPLGFAAYRFGPRTTDDRPRTTGDGCLENEFFRVEIEAETGLLTVTDLETGLVVRGVNRFVDGGDRGDEYNYCCPEKDEVVEAPVAPPLVRRLSDALGESLVVTTRYRVPAGLDPADRAARSRERVELPITTRVTLTPGVRRVDFETVVENTASDHRLRVHFPFPRAVERAAAEGHWDVVEWPLDLPTETAGWAEQPVPTRPQLGWASLSDGQVGMTVVNRGLPEVEALRTDGGTEIALTLLRCVGWLSRADLHCRQGHAGPGLETPGAQCPGRHLFRYALILHRGDWRAALPLADAFQTDLRAVVTDAHPGRLPPSLSFIRLEPDLLRLSAVKPPEEGAGLIVRLWNSAAQPVTGVMRLWRPCARAVRTDMAERDAEELARDSASVPLSLRGREVLTLRLTW